MKKLLSILLAVVLCLSACSVAVFAADADAGITMSVGTYSAKRGDTVNVVINMDTNAGFRALGISLEWDDSVLEMSCPDHDPNFSCLPELEKQTDFGKTAGNNVGENSQYHDVNPYVMQWAYGTARSNITYTGEMVNITFKVKNDAPIGTTDLTLVIDQASNVSGDSVTCAATSGKITVACATHTAGTPEVTKEATCTEAGTEVTKCSACGTVMSTKTLPATNHDWGNWEGSAEAKCGEQGEEKRVCKNDATHVETRKTNALEHLWDEGTVETSATCETAGKKVYKCTREDCDGTKDETIPALQHKWDEGEVTTDPGCETEGVMTYTCQNDATHTYTEAIEALGHKVEEWTVTEGKEPTLEAEGERTGTCTVCGDVVTEVIPKLTTSVEGDKIIYGTFDDNGDINFEEGPEGLKVETADGASLSGYVNAVVSYVEAAKDEIEELNGKLAIAGAAVILVDTDTAEIIKGTQLLKITLPISADLAAAYENLGVVVGDEEIEVQYIDGALVFTASADALAEGVTVVGTEKVVADEDASAGTDDGADTESPKTGESAAIAFAIVMMAIAAAGVVVTKKARA